MEAFEHFVGRHADGAVALAIVRNRPVVGVLNIATIFVNVFLVRTPCFSRDAAYGFAVRAHDLAHAGLDGVSALAHEIVVRGQRVASLLVKALLKLFHGFGRWVDVPQTAAALCVDIAQVLHARKTTNRDSGNPRRCCNRTVGVDHRATPDLPRARNTADAGGQFAGAYVC